MGGQPSPGARSPARSDYLSRAEALRILGVKPQTLYSYVSRGLIRRLTDPGSRTSCYHREDIQRLRARSVARSGHGPAAATAIHWGEPVLVTRITEITEDGPRYREHLAADLARRSVPFEAVAEYLWTGQLPARPCWPVPHGAAALSAHLADVRRLHPQAQIRQLLSEVVLLLGMDDHETSAADGDIARSKLLIRAMAGVFGVLGPSGAYAEPDAAEPIARGLARALGVAPDARKLHALDAMLVLLADHEFTPATFTARIAASAGSDLYSCIGAALPVHFGSGLGARCDRVDQLLDPSLFAGGVRIETVLHSARTPHGLDHPFYPDGDPRAKLAVELAAGIWNGGAGGPALAGGSGQHLTMEESLVVLCRALGAPQRAAGGLLAFARAAGWIAHVLEQRQEAFMIRPRGKFVAAQQNP